MRALAKKRGLDLHVQSAGTTDYHVGEAPDGRSCQAAAARGYALDGRAQHFTHALFDRFDLVVAMDAANLRALQKLARSEVDRQKLRLFRDYDAASPKGADVPDPYYGGAAGFDHVIELCEQACTAMLDALSEGRA